MKKRNLLLITMAIGCITLTGCGSSKKEDTAKDTTVQETTTEAETTTEEETTTVEETTVAEAATMDALVTDSDYDKVTWATTYQLFEDQPGAVASVTLYTDSADQYYLVVGITNLFDKSFSFSADAYAKGSSDETIGEKKINLNNIAPGNTCIFTIPCSKEIPTGKIHWENMEIREGDKDGVPWEADWGFTSDDGKTLDLNYTLLFNEGAPTNVDNFCGLLLSENGFVIGIYDETDYDAKSNSGVSKLPIDKIAGGEPVDLALFVNPTK